MKLLSGYFESHCMKSCNIEVMTYDGSAMTTAVIRPI